MNDRIKKNYGRDTSLIYYDVTNYYFETDEPNDFLRKGVCKDTGLILSYKWDFSSITKESPLLMNYSLEIPTTA